MRKTVLFITIFFVIACEVIFITAQQQTALKKTTILETKESQSSSNVIQTGTAADKVIPTSSFKNRPTLADLKLTLSNPATTIVSASTDSVVITGATSPLTSLIINEFELISDANGNFTKAITLDEGDNYINVIAYNTDGASAEKEIMVTRESAE